MCYRDLNYEAPKHWNRALLSCLVWWVNGYIYRDIMERIGLLPVGTLLLGRVLLIGTLSFNHAMPWLLLWQWPVHDVCIVAGHGTGLFYLIWQISANSLGEELNVPCIWEVHDRQWLCRLYLWAAGMIIQICKCHNTPIFSKMFLCN